MNFRTLIDRKVALLMSTFVTVAAIRTYRLYHEMFTEATWDWSPRSSAPGGS